MNRMDRVVQAYEERRASKRPGIIRTLLAAVIPSGPPKQPMVTQQPTPVYAAQPVMSQPHQYAAQAIPPYCASPAPYQQGAPTQQAYPLYQGSAQYQQPPQY